MRIGILWVACLGLTSCASGMQIDREALPTAETYPEEPAVILSEASTATFRLLGGKPAVDVETHRRLLILGERGRRLGDVAIGHDGGEFWELLDARVECLLPDGSRSVHALKDFDDHPVGSYGRTYSDQRVAFLDLPDLPAGTVVDVSQTVRTLDATLFAQRHFFGSDIPVLRSSFHAVFPEGWSLEHKFMRGWDEIPGPPKVTDEDEWTRWSWVRTNIPPIEEEPRAPNYVDRVHKVAVRLAGWQADGQTRATHSSFEDFGRFLADLGAGTAEPTPEIRATVHKVLAQVGEDDPWARAAALYEWVQENIRYVAIEVGIGGWRPYLAKETYDRRYGDCKDKATLLKAMLEVAGIKSYMTSLYSHGGVPRPYVFPNLGINSNHAILAIELGEELVVVDPTERTVPFGQLPPRDQEVDLVVIDHDNPRIVKTYGSRPEQNQRHATLELRKDGDAWVGVGSVEVTGAYFAWMKNRLLSAGGDDVGRTIGSYIPVSIRYFNSPEWQEIEREGTPALRAKMRLHVKTTEAEAGNRTVIRLNDFLGRPISDLEPGPRENPVVFYFRNNRSTELRLDIAGAAPSALPEAKILTSPFGRYEMSWSMDGDTLVARRSIRLEERLIPADHYDEFVGFLESIHRVEGQPIILERSPS